MRRKLGQSWKRHRPHRAVSVCIDYDHLEPRQLLASLSGGSDARTLYSDVPNLSHPHEIVANYREDFTQTDSNFSYQWNAPDGWSASGSPGDLSQGSLEQSDLHRDLVFDGRTYRAGDQAHESNQPANFLFLDEFGGHVGSHAFQANAHDRFAIVAYEVENSGFYSVIDSVITKYRDAGDGIEIKVWVEGDDVTNEFTTEAGKQYSIDFDTNLGFLNRGEKILIAVGAGDSHVADSFRWDFSIARFDGTKVADYRDNFAGANWSYYWNAPSNWNTIPNAISNQPITSGAVGDIDSYRPLVGGANLTPDGNLDGVDNFPAGYLRLNRNGGMPGASINENNVTDRFAIAAFEITNSGYYAITDSWLQKTLAKGNGIELLIHDSHRNTLHKETVNPLQTTSFDMQLGYLKKGESIYVAIGANGDHTADMFQLDYSIVAEPTIRTAPVKDIQTHHTIHVGNFGAVPNDSADDRIAIQNAINAAIQLQQTTGQAVTIQLAAGTYRLGIANAENLQIKGAENLVFQGTGQQETELLVTQHNAGLFRITDSENLIFRDFNVDYESLPFTQGDVIEVVDANTLIVQVDAGYRAPNDRQLFTDNLTSHRTQFLTADRSGRMIHQERYVIADLDSVEEVSPGVYEISYRRDFPGNLTAGDAWYQIARINNRSIFGAYRNDGFITISQVSAYAGPPGFVQGQDNGAINLLDVNIDLKDNRLVSLLGAAVHASRNKAGVWVENSRFVGLSDDIMNLYRQERDYLQQQLAPNRFLLSTTKDLHQGERVVFYRDDGYRHEAKIVSVVNGQLVTDRAIVGFDANTRLAPIDHASTGSVIRDNVIERHRAGKGSLIVWSPNTTIIGNQFRSINTHAIATNGYEEQTLSDGLIVQGNHFQDVGFSSFQNETQFAAIETGRNTRRNHILDNSFSELFGNAIEDTSLDTSLDNNRFENGDKLPS